MPRAVAAVSRSHLRVIRNQPPRGPSPGAPPLAGFAAFKDRPTGALAKALHDLGAKLPKRGEQRRLYVRVCESFLALQRDGLLIDDPRLDRKIREAVRIIFLKLLTPARAKRLLQMVIVSLSLTAC
jgi:hypothetical protein